MLRPSLIFDDDDNVECRALNTRQSRTQLLLGILLMRVTIPFTLQEEALVELYCKCYVANEINPH